MGNTKIEQKYISGKQKISLILNLLLLMGYTIDIVSFFDLYMPVQLEFHFFGISVIAIALVLQVVNSKRNYVLSTLIVSYYMFFSIIVDNVFFSNFSELIFFTRGELFARNIFFLLP